MTMRNAVRPVAFAPDVLVVGGGLGGVSAALAAVSAGLTVAIYEPTSWLGGQLTSQAVPPDEHPWIETDLASRSYAELRTRIRDLYRRSYPLRDDFAADPHLNPGLARVSRIAHEPRIAVAAIDEMLASSRASGRLVIETGWSIDRVDGDPERVTAVHFNDRRGENRRVSADVVIDATELGDVLALAGIPCVIGAESRDDTGEAHAPETADAIDQQAISWCFALDYVEGTDNTIARPDAYEYWRDRVDPRWPGPQLAWTDVVPFTLEPRHLPLFRHSYADSRDAEGMDLWRYRRILSQRILEPGALEGDITLVNWPQTDYWESPLLSVSTAERERTLARTRDLNLSFLHWCQTEAPRPDGGQGYPGLRLRADIVGTGDGMAMHPYIRESRRVRALLTVTEGHIGVEMRGDGAGAEWFEDSVGIGWYRIDLHPSTSGRNYVDVDCFPFQIPLRALIPQQRTNVLPAAKNIGTTHITNGAFRLHPVEWAIGEAAGTLAAVILTHRISAHDVADDVNLVRDVQRRLRDRGVPLDWPEKIARGEMRHDSVPASRGEADAG